MTQFMKLPADARMRAVRVLPGMPAEGSEAHSRVQWLLSLGASRARQQAEHEALLVACKQAQKALQVLPLTLNARLDEVAGLAVQIGLAVAREVIGAALDQGAFDPTPVVARVLRDCVAGADGTEVRVHLHPDDLAPVMNRIAVMPEFQGLGGRVHLLADPRARRGAVRAETSSGELRWEPEAVFERIASEVRREAGA